MQYGYDNNHKGIKMLVRLIVTAAVAVALSQAAFAHGGGCKKSSPPGQCCHMDNKAGAEHCH